MSFLIDGNNLMALRVGWHRDRDGARRLLMDDLANFAIATRVKLEVVFDGKPLAHFADGARYRGIRVFYARPGSNADERIKEFVEASGERRTLYVVTSDRALGDYVRRCGAPLIRSGEFRRRIDAALRVESTNADAVDAPKTDREMDEWMRYFGVAPDDDD